QRRTKLHEIDPCKGNSLAANHDQGTGQARADQAQIPSLQPASKAGCGKALDSKV
ncbi:hypothetical protein GGI02_005700, partial [Coemansia sp. RSA 2322]